MKNIEHYLEGKSLYGDDFSEVEIKKWFEEEAEGYFDLIKDKSSPVSAKTYQYHNLNIELGYRFLPVDIKFSNVLGIGSSYGYEFLPISKRIDNLTILEPSENMKSSVLGSLVPKYKKPTITGEILFPDNHFDLITCFGTLHHIPNVSHVIQEMIRVTKPGKFLLIREPIRTMGDWRNPRIGLTKNERGIPVQMFRNFWKAANVQIISERFCESLFALRPLMRFFPLTPGSNNYQKLDNLISSLTSWNIHYHPKSLFQKMAPGSVFYVLQKSE